ncbi:MAG TPA: FAD-binding protein [Thermoanaerobaculia bacterium]|jgi:glycolate oxidase FAD binding subunit|nr:FAD-binding protein [Thermoanaerobaculia bacterium]
MTPEDVQQSVAAAIESGARLLPRGGGSKTALSTAADGASTLDLSDLSGVLEYLPEEYTFTALAGTRVKDVTALLAEKCQYLPFDPLLAERGATLGGSVAAGANGPGRQRYGGARDFLLAVRFVDGAGNLVRGGAKVVKNSAGFDLPKLMVGSLGRLGVLVELTFKVFPAPEAYATLASSYPSLDAALKDVVRLSQSPLELHALDLEPAETGWRLWIRLGGLVDALPARIERVRAFLSAAPAETVDDHIWREVKELEWVPQGWSLIKIPLTPKRIPALEERLKGIENRRRYSAGGNVAWLACPASTALDPLLTDLHLSGLVLLGQPGKTRLGVDPGAPFARRIKQALDPDARFLDL